MSQTSSNGLVLWEGASALDGSRIVVIATGMLSSSRNVATGDMVQTWILLADMPPNTAVHAGMDGAVCGTCQLRGVLVNGAVVGRGCYVLLHQAPLAVWRGYRSGRYPRATDIAAVGAGRNVRLGAYGDPAAAPYSVWDELVSGARSWTGYTHQWQSIPADPWAGLLMASVEGTALRDRARALGWRSFIVMADNDETVPVGAVRCPKDREYNKRQCAQCGACAGTRRGQKRSAVDIAIRAHGFGRKSVATVVRSSELG